MNGLNVLILAAGQGKRMHSELPKVLHQVAGRPLLSYVVDAARALAPARMCIVHGHGGDLVKAAFPHADLTWVNQDAQLGTGHAVQQALPQLGGSGVVLVLYGDMPLIAPDTLTRLVDAAAGGLSIL